MTYKYGELSLGDMVLFCEPKKRPKHQLQTTRYFSVVFTDSLIKVCSEKFKINCFIVRQSLRNLIKNERKKTKAGN